MVADMLPKKAGIGLLNNKLIPRLNKKTTCILCTWVSWSCLWLLHFVHEASQGRVLVNWYWIFQIPEGLMLATISLLLWWLQQRQGEQKCHGICYGSMHIHILHISSRIYGPCYNDDTPVGHCLVAYLHFFWFPPVPILY